MGKMSLGGEGVIEVRGSDTGWRGREGLDTGFRRNDGYAKVSIKGEEAKERPWRGYARSPSRGKA